MLASLPNSGQAKVAGVVALPEPYNSEFPGTPNDATLSCATEEAYRAILPSGVK